VTDSTTLSPTRLAQTAAHLLGTSLNDVVPPDAQRHLLNAQRELLLAVILTIEHNASRVSGDGSAPTVKRTRKTRAKPAASRRPSRVTLD